MLGGVSRARVREESFQWNDVHSGDLPHHAENTGQPGIHGGPQVVDAEPSCEEKRAALSLDLELAGGCLGHDAHVARQALQGLPEGGAIGHGVAHQPPPASREGHSHTKAESRETGSLKPELLGFVQEGQGDARYAGELHAGRITLHKAAGCGLVRAAGVVRRSPPGMTETAIIVRRI